MKKNNLKNNDTLSHNDSAGKADNGIGSPASTAKKPDEKQRPLWIILLLLLFFIPLLLLLITWRTDCGRGDDKNGGCVDYFVRPDTLTPASTDSLAQAVADSLAQGDSLAQAVTAPPLAQAGADSLARVRDSISRARDSIAKARTDSLAQIRDSIIQVRADSLARADSIIQAHADSLARIRDSLTYADSLARARADSIALAAELARIAEADVCVRDTLLPQVYADPSGGQHRQPVAVKFIANKECRIEWSLDGGNVWNVYDGTPINISNTAILQYRAQDRCGKTMDVRSKRYTFDFTDRSAQCPPDMEYVNVDGKEFCIDIYQWPNRRGTVPSSFVSLFQAMDSCFSVRKRLCTSDEWTTACAGPEDWAYTYGNTYDANACVTRDTAAARSGGWPECRGYFEVFDMSGNLGEWTSTPSPQNRAFNNVMGGFWASGSHSRCADARFSYFPQNRHNPVGFRCCRDIVPLRDASPRGK